MTTGILPDVPLTRNSRVLTREQTERAAALMRLMLLGKITLPQLLDALPGQLPMERAA